MSAVEIIHSESLPALVDRAARALSDARSSAEVLEARDMAGLAYDVAKRAARVAKAKGAHDTLIAAAHRAQADALLIESQAKRRLADEYDAAQERGEVATDGRPKTVLDGNCFPAIASDLGLSRKAIHEARKIRSAEVKDPGVVQRTLNDAIERGDEPTRAAVKKAVSPIHYMREKAEQEERDFIDKRDFRALRKLWKQSSPEAQRMFRDWLNE